MWKNKRVLLGVTGGIAAYKAIYMASALTKKGALVDVVLTQSAKEFVTPLSFSSITGRGVYDDMFTHIDGEIAHIHLSKSDMIIMIPATKNEIAKLAAGIADSLLLNAIYASKSDVYIAPAMNSNMYEHSSTKHCLDMLTSYGYTIIPPIEGLLACKSHGIGKLDDPEKIIKRIEEDFHVDSLFYEKKVVLTGGPTISKLDPIRIFTNRSSGKMANAIGRSLFKRGANVVYIGLNPPSFKANKYVPIETTEDMLKAVKDEIKDADMLIMSAAPLDYEFETYFDSKIKKKEDMVLRLKRTPDILKTLKKDLSHLKVIGFAAETDNHLENGKAKLREKDLDYIVINDVSSKTMGMGSNLNSGLVIHQSGSEKTIHPMEKEWMAEEILNFIEEQEKCL